MAKNYMNSSMPLDTPIVLRPGVMHRESDYHGNAKWLALPPEHPERADKGDLGETVISGLETKPLSHPGLPFELKPGKVYVKSNPGAQVVGHMSNQRFHMGLPMSVHLAEPKKNG